MSWKLPLGGFKRVDEISQFYEDFVKNYNKDRDIGYFLKVDVLYPEKLHELHNDLPFLTEGMKNFKNFLVNLYGKKSMLSAFPKLGGLGEVPAYVAQFC